jgi:hypothetical protein
MYEFLRAIADSKVPHFQSIFFHNCLMGGVETLFDISLFCDYIVCSSHMLAQNPAPIRQFIKAVTEQPDIEKAYLQMLGGLLPEWESGYNGSNFNGDLKLINCETLVESVIEPSMKLADRLTALYPTMQAQLDTAMVHTYQYYNMKKFYDLGDYANKVAEYTKGRLSGKDQLGLYLQRGLRVHQLEYLHWLGRLAQYHDARTTRSDYAISRPARRTILLLCTRRR